MQRITKAILPVAGLGTRFLPATKAQPKEMLPIVDKPMIQLLVEEAIASGITEIIFVTGKGKRAIEDHFDYAPELEAVLVAKGKHEMLKKVREISDAAHFTYVRQKEPRGDGDAILCAAHLIGPDEPVAVLFGDDLIVGKEPCLRQMIDVYERFHASVIAVEPVPRSQVSQYGIVAGKKIDSHVTKIDFVIEKPKLEETSSNLAIVGKYVVTPEVMTQLRKVEKKGEIRLADAFIAAVGVGAPVYGYRFDGVRYDCGSKIGFLKATVALGIDHPETAKDFKKYLRGLNLK